MMFSRVLEALRQVSGLVWRFLVFVLAAGIVVFVVDHWNRWEGEPGAKVTDDAYLQTDLTPINAKVPGYVRAVPVQDYEHVHAGQLIAEIVDDDYRASVAQTEAAVAAAAAQIETLEAQEVLQEANIRAARAVVEATAANLAQNIRDVNRQHRLLATGSSSSEASEHVETSNAQLTALLAQNRAQADGAERQLKVLIAQEAQAKATLAAQQANSDLAKINLGYTRIVAPRDGVLGLRQVFPGQYLPVGGQVTVLAALPNVWILANYKETQLTHVRVGESASATVDTFPGHRLRGHVEALSPASGAELALLPPDNATGNFTKIVQRIVVKIVIDDADGLADRLRPGMSVVATINATEDGKAPGGNPR